MHHRKQLTSRRGAHEIMAAFKTLESTKYTSSKTERFCTIDKVQKIGTKRIFFAVRNEESKNIVSTMFARKYDADKVVSLFLSKQ